MSPSTSSIVSIISTSLSESISGASVLNSVFNSWASGVVIMAAAAGANVVVGVGLLVVVLLVVVVVLVVVGACVGTGIL